MEDKVWVFADYKQAECMVVAWKGPVPKLKEWFKTGEDIHTNVCRLIAKTVQEHKIFIPNQLFTRKPWNEYSKDDPERDSPSKNTVHANNYGMQKRKFSLITGLPEKYAELIQGIYFALFPEIKTKYQAGIDEIARTSKTLEIPVPPERRITFYDQYGEELKREMYAMYAQATVGDLLIDTFNDCWDSFERGVEPVLLKKPIYLPVPIKLQVHDSIGVPVYNNFRDIDAVCKTIKDIGERTIYINGDPLVIPMDFAVGKNWGKYHVCSAKCPNDCKRLNPEGCREWVIGHGYKDK